MSLSALTQDLWPEVPIKRLFRVVNGSTPRSGEAAYWNGDIDWATPDDLGQLQGTQLSSTRRRISDSGLASCGTTLVPPGSLVLSTRAPIGHIAETTIPVCTNQGCRSLWPAATVNSRYYYYALRAATDDLRSLGRGTTFQELSSTDLANFRVPRPPAEQQRAIADFLDRKTAVIDALIEKKERLIALLREKRQALITQAVTKGLDPSVPMKDSGIEWLGEVPAHWEVVRFRHACRAQQGLQIPRAERLYEPAEGALEYLTVRSIHATADDYVREFIVNPPTRVRCEPDDVLLSRTGATGEAITNQRGAFHNNFFKVDYERSRLDRHFLVNYLRCRPVHEYLRKMAGTTTIPDLNHGEFLAAPLLLPPLREQREIGENLASRLAEADELTRRVTETKALLRECRQAVITATVTGKLDVAQGAA